MALNNNLYWCETCQEETEQLHGYCLTCGTDMLWGGPPSKKLCSWCYVYEREEGESFCTSCMGDMERTDHEWPEPEEFITVTAVIPPAEEEIERIPCRSRR